MSYTTTRAKNCYCYTCGKDLHYMGVAGHRAMHRRKKEDCRIHFTDDTVRTWKYSGNKK